MGIDHSPAAAGTAGFGAPCPKAKGLASRNSRQLLAPSHRAPDPDVLEGLLIELARGVAAGEPDILRGLQPGLPPLRHVKIDPAHDLLMFGAEVVLPASQEANREDGSASTTTSTPSAYGNPDTK